MKKKYLILTIILGILLFVLFYINTSMENQVNSQENTNIVQAIDKYIEQSGLNGSVLVAIRGEVIFKRGYGYSEYDKKELNTATTVFKIGSITKQFTSMAVLMLEEQGLLNVTDTIDKYFSDFPQGDKITIHNLLTHTSGIADYFCDSLYYPIKIIQIFQKK